MYKADDNTVKKHPAKPPFTKLTIIQFQQTNILFY